MEIEIYDATIVTRMSERILITIIIISISVILMVAFWKRVQRIQFEILQKEAGAKADIIFAMPVFLLLVLVLFAYVSFSSPVGITKDSKISNPDASEDTSRKNVDASDKPTSEVRRTFSGLGPMETSDVPIYLNALNSAQSALRSSSAPSNRTAASQLKFLQRRIVLEFFGKDLVDKCRDQSTENYALLECKDVRLWFE